MVSEQDLALRREALKHADRLRVLEPDSTLRGFISKHGGPAVWAAPGVYSLRDGAVVVTAAGAAGNYEPSPDYWTRTVWQARWWLARMLRARVDIPDLEASLSGAISGFALNHLWYPEISRDHTGDEALEVMRGIADEAEGMVRRLTAELQALPAEQQWGAHAPWRPRLDNLNAKGA